MRSMPRPRKPYVHKETTRHGKTVWYFRRGKEARIRLPGVFGSKEFSAAYDQAAAGKPIEKRATAPQSSMRWLVDRYYESGRYSKMKPNTQRNHRLMLESVCKNGGDRSFRNSTSADIMAGVVRREATPRMAATYVSVMRAVFDFAKDSGWIAVNPVGIDIKARQEKSDGYHTWTVEEVERYQERHPVGTQARLAMDIFLFTGLRRSDAVTLGHQHVRGGVLSIRAGKNGAEITIPLLAPLRASIEAAETGDLIFLFNSRKQPWKSNSFGYWFADRCIEAGIIKGRAHGLRKAGATIAANNGATPFELTAMYGWSSTKMAEVYTRKADRVKLAERAANKLFPHQPKGAGKRRKSPSENK
ncbi:integrase [Mesorhizobium loti]|uniref:Integrase n=2 Tax=Mesorhizobium jarvisii TaxID=1777867 RepID=A0A6M7TLT4_9HYPH|nr:integrase [Mesorhizobium jarvisii]QKD11825.1 integrase [Mesorhizobium loti]RJT37932.1 integrase [Mesorhizobium jarvisii]